MVKLIPLIIFVVALVTRIGFRVLRGQEDMIATAYLQYLQLANNIVNNGEYILTTYYGPKAAFWPPVYPLFVAVFDQGDRLYLPFVIASSIVGAITAVMAYLIGRELFDSWTGMFAGLYSAVYPYFVVHDVAVQETGLFTCVTAVTIFLLLRAQKRGSNNLWIFAGIALGSAALTRASILPFVFLLIGWLLIRSRRAAVLVTMAFCVMTVPWLIRNYYTLGEPVLTSQTGRFLWIAHNSSTFARYPEASIDRSEELAWTLIPEDQKETILSLNEAEQSRHFWAMGRQYVYDDPALATSQALRKVAVAFSWEFSPQAEGAKQTVYFVSYFPILALGLIGMFLAGQRWKDLMPVYLLIAGFITGTAVFWAHTSHRTYIDIYFMIFAGSAVSWLYSKRKNLYNKTGYFGSVEQH